MCPMPDVKVLSSNLRYQLWALAFLHSSWRSSGFVFRFSIKWEFHLCCGFSESQQHVDSCLRGAVRSLCWERHGPPPGSVCTTSHRMATGAHGTQLGHANPELVCEEKGIPPPNTPSGPRHSESSPDGKEGSQV